MPRHLINEVHEADDDVGGGGESLEHMEGKFLCVITQASKAVARGQESPTLRYSDRCPPSGKSSQEMRQFQL